MTVQTPNTNAYGVPLNVTKYATKVTHVSITANTASPSGGLVLQSTTKSILIVPDDLPSAPIYIRYGEGAVRVASASANESDRKLSPAYPSLQEGTAERRTTHVSFFSTVAQTVSVYELA